MASINYESSSPLTFPTTASQAKIWLERFCQEAFPGSRPYWNYSGKLSVSLNMGDGAWGTVEFSCTDLPQEPNALGPTCQVVISGYMYGSNVSNNARGIAEVQRFAESIANSLQQTIDGYINSTRFRITPIKFPPGWRSPSRGLG